MTHQDINALIKQENVNTNFVSDGFHTFGELYEHRITLFLVLLKELQKRPNFDRPLWRTRLHDNGEEWKGWIIVGIGERVGEQITYHLPDTKWAECAFLPERERAPTWDGHSSDDVLERLKKL
jgi:hypothetical protein